MANFTIEMSSPFRSGWTGVLLGGPNDGDHGGTSWPIQFGMDLAVETGTEVLAAFNGKLWFKGYVPHDKSKDNDKHYGIQVIMVSDDGKLLGFYTHFTGPNLVFGKTYAKGERLGVTLRDHLHLALATLEGGKEKGVNLYQQFLEMKDLDKTISVTFKDGSPPTVSTVK